MGMRALQKGNERRAWECAPYRRATSGAHGNARPTERQRAACMGMRALQNGNERRAWECAPYSRGKETRCQDAVI